MQMYFGDVSLCYSYSLAMALDAYGYNFKAEFLIVDIHVRKSQIPIFFVWILWGMRIVFSV